MYTDVYDIGFFCLRLYDLGHQIVGVEVAEQALEQFFKEHQLEFSVKPLAGGGKLYEACLRIFVYLFLCRYHCCNYVDIMMTKLAHVHWNHFANGLGMISNEIWVNIGSCNGLLPDSTKPLPEQVLTHHQRCSVAMTWAGSIFTRCVHKSKP